MADTVSYETFQRQKYPKFGHENPEPMNFEFWKYMIEMGYSAWEAREQFGCTNRLREGPIWSFERNGMSKTQLSDGRTIYIGGEHEDHYDPDFCIYNDVIVQHRDGEFEIYGYPMNVFTPTDFHSATLVNNKIYIIGSLGYMQDRVPGITPVFCLDCDSLAMQKVETTGDNPGWISDHEAEFLFAQNCITITNGKIIEFKGDEQLYIDNSNKFYLDLSTNKWYRDNPKSKI